MTQEFGTLLRELRTRSKKSMGEIARHLKVSVSYVSDVEHGHRAPFTAQRIREVADFLAIDPTPLFEAAAQSRGVIELSAVGASPSALSVGAALARGWPGLSEEDLAQIRTIVEKQGGANGGE